MSIVAKFRNWWTPLYCGEVKSTSFCQIDRKETRQTKTPFRCHDADACKFGQAPCPTPACCGCAVTTEGFKPAGAVMQIEEPAKKDEALSRQELHALFLAGYLGQSARMCDKLQGIEEERDHWLPASFAYGLCGAAIAVICMKLFA